jgi:hypothetical protein
MSDENGPITEDMREASASNTREWDGDEAIDAFPGAREKAEKQLAKEYADVVNAQAEQEEGSVETEEVAEEEELQVSEETEEVELETSAEEPEEITPRADKRIQKLVSEKKAAESRMEALVAQLAQAELARQQAEQQRLQEVAYERQMREVEMRKQQRMRMLEEAGFDPTDPRNQYMMVVGDENQALKEKLAWIEQNLTARQEQEKQAEGWRVYNANLDKALKSTLAGRTLDPETEEAVRKSVTAMATLNNSADPIEEVRTVLRPFVKLLKPAGAPAPQAAPTNTQAHRAVALKGTTGNRKPGDKAGSSKPGRLTVEQASEALWGKSDWAS